MDERTAVKVGPVRILALPGEVSSGTIRLRSDHAFDFDKGVETGLWAADRDVYLLFGPDYSGGRNWKFVLDVRELAFPEKQLKQLTFDEITLSDLAYLSYQQYYKEFYPPSGAQPPFGVRTTSGKFVKVQILNCGDDLQLRWVTFDWLNLEVKIVLGSAPTWLVTRYAVECTYNIPRGVRECCKGISGPEGAVIVGRVSNEGGAFPSTVVVTVTLDFNPDTMLPRTVRSFAVPVTDTGVSFLFEPNQFRQDTTLLLDLNPPPLRTDYLLLNWSHIAGETVVASGKKSLSGDELLKQAVTEYHIVFIPDPISAKHLIVAIEGRYQNQELPLFRQLYELSDKAVIIRAYKALGGEAYALVSL
jgi:hypothetical protein